MKPALPDSLQKLLLEYFESETSIQKVFLFGSRVRGEHDSNSDIDLLLYAEPHAQEPAIRAAIEDLPTLHRFDIHFHSPSLDPKFLEIISKEAACLYERETGA